MSTFSATSNNRNPVKASLGGHRRTWRGVVRHHRAQSRRDDQRRVARHRRGLHLFHRLPVLRPVHRRQGSAASIRTGRRRPTGTMTASTTCRPTNTCSSVTISRPIAGAGPLVGPVLAAQMGYLPGTIWILAGVVFAGAVQDMTVLFLSTRRDGRSLGDMIRAEMGPVAGGIALIGVLLIMIILLAVLALVVVKALMRQPVGHLHRVRDDPDRAADGRLCPLHPRRQDRRDVGHRLRAADDGADLRPHGLAETRRSRRCST